MKSNPGSAILLVVIISSILLIGTTALWRSASLSFESAIYCYKAQKTFYAAESLAIYGIAMIKNNLITINKLKPNKDILIYQGSWPKQSKTNGRLVVQYDPKTKIINLKADVFDSNYLEPIASTSLVCTQKKDSFIINEWVN
jgi:hypothetical protein